MKRSDYEKIEAFMRSCMQDAAHDKLHVYRVVNYAAQLAENTPEANFDIVLAAALLHDIGRMAELRDPAVCHAEAGSQMARDFLQKNGFSPAFSESVAQCILTHRHKNGRIPQSLEGKLVYDADKLDLIGNIGAARCILYGVQIDEPLYRTAADGAPTPGDPSEPPSLFREYHRKLQSLSQTLYTPAARALAARQQEEMDQFFHFLISEVQRNHHQGRQALQKHLT